MGEEFINFAENEKINKKQLMDLALNVKNSNYWTINEMFLDGFYYDFKNNSIYSLFNDYENQKWGFYPDEESI